MKLATPKKVEISCSTYIFEQLKKNMATVTLRFQRTILYARIDNYLKSK
jgi:hypothetical protein